MKKGGKIVKGLVKTGLCDYNNERTGCARKPLPGASRLEGNIIWTLRLPVWPEGIFRDREQAGQNPRPVRRD